MRMTRWAAFAAAMAVGGTAAAADPKLVTFFKETCGVCHGEAGEGTPKLAPPLKGNKWVVDSSAADVAKTIKGGREGAAKRHPDLPPMPPNSMSDSRLQAVTDYVKGDLQK